jgi:hypothetical protein
VRRIHWTKRTPITILIDKPSPWPQTLQHAPDRRFLSTGEPEQRQTQADQIKRVQAKRIQRILEDIVLAHLEIRKIDSLQIGDIDVCGHDFAALANLLG